MTSTVKVTWIIIGGAWGLFALFTLGLLVASWHRRRERRKRKGHRRKHKEWG